jgi:putative SOS response-associated peptidase YedK
MRIFNKPTDEKRMVVILPTNRYQDWLQASAEHCMEFLRPFPADALRADESLYKSPIDQQMF